MKKTLWTKDFTCITAATALSAVGGEAMNLPISLLVFDETGSTFLSAMILVCGMLPDVLLSVLVAPLIDKGGKKKWIVGLDMLLALLYLSVGVWVGRHAFSYGLYIVFTLLIGTLSVFYRLAYTAWYPDLIPAGLEQKGYAVSSTIYPLVIILMSPAAAFLYEKMTMKQIFYIVFGLTMLSVLLEGSIREKGGRGEDAYSFSQYKRDIAEGFAYLKREKGIRNIYTYMSITQGTSNGMELITQAFYQTNPVFNVTMLGFLRSAEMTGRILGGFFQYIREIPAKKRYAFTRFVYLFYSAVDMVLLFLPYPAMLAGRFACGALGTTSATIRETAVQSYLPERMRARVNAFFDVFFAVGGMLFQLLAGVLGQVFSYRTVAVLLGMVSFFSVFFLIILPAKENRPVYEAERLKN